MKITLWTSASAFALLFAACGGNDSPPNTDETPESTPAVQETPARAGGSADFEGSASGALNESMSGGTAFWITRSTEPAIEFFVLNLYPQGGRISFTRMAPGLPEPGTYPIDSDGLDASTFQMVYVPDQSSRSASGTGGTLTLTSVTPDRVEGSYEVEGMVWDPSNPTGGSQPVQFRGTFTAACDASAEGNFCQ